MPVWVAFICLRAVDGLPSSACVPRRGILGEWLEDMVALEEMVTVLGGSSHHSDGLNWSVSPLSYRYVGMRGSFRASVLTSD